MEQEDKVRIEVDGFIARSEGRHVYFSNQPMKKDGFWSDGIWYNTLETKEGSPLDLRVDMHKYVDIPGLTFENSPRHCKLIFEIGEQLPGNDQREIDRRAKVIRVRRNVRTLAEETGRSFDDTVAILRKAIPDIDEYLKDSES